MNKSLMSTVDDSLVFSEVEKLLLQFQWSYNARHQLTVVINKKNVLK